MTIVEITIYRKPKEVKSQKQTEKTNRKNKPKKEIIIIKYNKDCKYFHSYKGCENKNCSYLHIKNKQVKNTICKYCASGYCKLGRNCCYKHY